MLRTYRYPNQYRYLHRYINYVIDTIERDKINTQFYFNKIIQSVIFSGIHFNAHATIIQKITVDRIS